MYFMYYIIYFFHACVFFQEIYAEEIHSLEEWTSDKLIPKGYKKNRPPKPPYGGPARVNVSLSLHQVLSVNEAEQSLTMELYYDQNWIDHRIDATKLDLHEITLDGSFKDKIWTPSLYFANSLHSAIIEVSQNTLFLEVSNKSHFLLSSRVKVTLSCKMDLFRFPQDTQECFIDMACVTSSNRSVTFVWNKFTVNETAYPNRFEITGYSQEYCQTYRGPEFPCLRAKIKLFRRISYYLIRIYGPSFLLVITAFCGFWVPAVGYPARIALIVTPLLSLITQQTQINAEINVSYVVALHIWMMASISFVFFCLIEYCLAIVYCHIVDEKKDRANDSISTYYSSGSSLSHFIKISLIKLYGDIDWSKAPLDRNKIDYVARIVFPVLYFIFILIYLSVFLFPWLGSKYL